MRARPESRASRKVSQRSDYAKDPGCQGNQAEPRARVVVVSRRYLDLEIVGGAIRNRRVGFATGYDAKLSVSEMAGWTRRADELGFEMAFFSETVELMRDSVTTLAAIAIETKTL